MAKKENNFYFDSFSKSIAYANEAAILLQKSFDNFDVANIKAQYDEMHKIEHAADGVKHEMMERLVKEFLPPIEREDIVELAHTIDEVTDIIDDVMLRVYMYNVTEIRPDVKEFTDLITRSCDALKVIFGELYNFRKSTALMPKMVEVNSLEEKGDRLHAESMHRLYTEEKEAVNILVWTNIYDRLEKCCDSCEKVVDMVELVIMKNS